VEGGREKGKKESFFGAKNILKETENVVLYKRRV
jgi:hypothetical protein